MAERPAYLGSDPVMGGLTAGQIRSGMRTANRLASSPGELRAEDAISPR